MNRQHAFDCIIIGAGINGLMLAFELDKHGLSVLVCDKGRIGQESSWAGGGILSPLYPWRYPAAVNRLARWSQRHYPALSEILLAATGMDIQLIQSGMLILEHDDWHRACAWSDKFGCELASISAAELQDLEPGIARQNTAMFLPGVAQVRNPRLVKALRKYLSQRPGIQLEEKTPVIAFLQQGRQITGVKTPQQTWCSKYTVLAAGAWSSSLGSLLGLSLPVYPVRGQMLLYGARHGMLKHICLSHGKYLIPRRDGQILVGSTLENVGFDRTCTRQANQDLDAFARGMLPDLDQHADLLAQWSGLRPGTPQEIPMIGASPGHTGLWINTGQFRNGIVLAPASARLCVDLMLGHAPIVEPSAYRPVISQASAPKKRGTVT